MNWKYLSTLILAVAAIGLVSFIAFESASDADVAGKVVAQSAANGIDVPGTNGKVKAFENGVYSVQPQNFAISPKVREMPPPDPETVAKQLLIPEGRTLRKQRRNRQLEQERIAKGLPPMTEDEKNALEINEQNSKLVKKVRPGAGLGDSDFIDPLVKNGAELNAPQAMPTPSISFDGATAADNAAIGVGGLSPPDTNGDVGPNHYVSSVNLALKFFNKSGTVVAGPIGTDDIFASLPVGDPCRARNDGDPIVVYDQLADRWHISQFSLPGFDGDGVNNFQCVAISTTGDPTGSYYVWSYLYPGNLLNDYPKVGIWTDAYHMTFNQFNNSGTAFLGMGILSQDRPRALAGDPTAGVVYVNIAPIDPNAGGGLPLDIEGFVPPPAGMAAVIGEYRADEFGDPLDALRFYKWVPDFDTPGSSAVSVLPDLALAPFDARQPSGRGDIEVSGGTALDSLSDRLMHRLVYRNMGTFASPVNSITGSFAVNVSGVNPTSAATYQTAQRWFELRRSADTFSVFDQGTHNLAPVSGTGLNNWMGSISQDNQGNLALGFSQSGTTQNADIKIAGRTNNVANSGVLNEGEALFHDALGAQSGSNRWGDYSMMSVDPVDDCTFWYTQEYYASGATGTSWSTRVGSFKFPACAAAPKGTITGTITSCSSGLPIDDANVTATGGFQRLTVANGTYSMQVAPGNYTVNADKAPGSVGTPQVTTVTNGGTSNVNICLTGVPILSGGTTTVVSESCGLPNQKPDPGETLTLTLPIINNGGAPTTSLVATLQNTGGVTNAGPVQNYGAIPDSGGSVSRDFTFTVNEALVCGGDITLTWNLVDGVTSLGTITKTLSSGVPVLNISQNFDGVTAPALPAGWLTTQAGSGTLWVTNTATPISAPNSAFTTDPATSGEASLETPAFNVSSAAATATFDISHSTEAGFDGMVLEIKIGAGAYQDILTAGGTFTANGYNGTLANFSGCSASPNPLALRQAWNGNSNGVKSVGVNLPAAANGQSVQLRFRMGTDCSVGGTGMRVDNVQVTAGVACEGPCGGGTPTKVRADYDGDGTTDLSVYRPSNGNWYVMGSQDGFLAVNWGVPGDIPMAGDFSGDGQTDLIVRRHIGDTVQADFHILKTDTFTYEGIPWGYPSDIALIGDYDDDGLDEIAVFRPSDHYFYIRDEFPSYRAVNFGDTGDIPMSADFDGNGRTDLAVFRPSNGFWYITDPDGSSVTSFGSVAWGLSDDKPVAADYDGDGKDDVAVFRPSNGTWYIRRSSDGQFDFRSWGFGTDTPIPGDYDGDGTYDIAVFRDGTWYILGSQAGFFARAWGFGTDVPMPSKYLP